MTSDDPFLSVQEPDGSVKLFPKGAYIVDARMFPGNSGGPVIIYNPLSNLRLGGLISATNRSFDYGIVTPASQVEQTLDRAKDSEPNINAWFQLDQTSSR